MARVRGANALTDAQIAWICFEAATGRRYKEIAAELGVAICTVANYGRAAIGYRTPPASWDQLAIIRDTVAGNRGKFTYKGLAAELGLSVYTVRRHAHKQCVQPPPQHD